MRRNTHSRHAPWASGISITSSPSASLPRAMSCSSSPPASAAGRSCRASYSGRRLRSPIQQSCGGSRGQFATSPQPTDAEMNTMDQQKLTRIARALVAPGKGILAMDESSCTIRKRFEEVGVKDTEETRRAYREMLLTTPGLGRNISGAILFDETIRQKTAAGSPVPRVPKKQGIIPGIKVDKGTREFAPGELLTEGLDDLRERLAEYRMLGAQFAKWRVVIAIGNGIPSEACIDANARALAQYALLCQQQGIVPVVEPEVLMDGTHTIQRSFEVTRSRRLRSGASRQPFQKKFTASHSSRAARVT